MSEPLLLSVWLQVHQHLCGVEGADPCATHKLSLSDSRELFCLWSCLISSCHGYVIKSVSRKSFHQCHLMSMEGAGVASMATLHPVLI